MCVLQTREFVGMRVRNISRPLFRKPSIILRWRAIRLG